MMRLLFFLASSAMEACAHLGTSFPFYSRVRIQLGQLLVSVGVHGQAESFIARWEQIGQLQAMSKWASYTVSGDDVVKVPTACLDTVFIWRLSDDQKSAAVHLPAEVRPS